MVTSSPQPGEVWPFFHHRRSLLKLLLKTTAQAIRELVDERYLGVRIGIVHTVHTGGRDPGFKPHVRSSALLRAGLVMAKGGLRDRMVPS